MKLFIKNLPVRFKIFFLLSIIISTATITEGLYVNLIVKKALEKNIESELANTTQAILDMVRTGAAISIRNRLRAIAEKNHDILTLVYTRFLKGQMSEDEAKKLASDILLSQTVGSSGYIFCLDSSGRLKVHPEAELIGTDISNYDFVKKQIGQKQGYIEYEWANPGSTKRPKALYMVYFKPWDWIISVSAYRNEFKELVNVNDFREGVLSRKFGNSGYSYIIDTKGNLLLHPKLEGTNIYDAIDTEGRRFIEEVCTLKNGKIIYPWKNPGERSNRQKLVIFNYLPQFDWIVASSSYLEEFYTPLGSIRKTIALTTILTLIATLIFTLWISSFFTKPLNRFMESFERGARGDFTARIPARSEDEIGKLASYFNLFMESLDAHTKKLEGLVQSRTRELEQANVRLSELASMDSLTNIANRRTFQKELEKQISLAARNRTPLSLVMADIDHFKKFNDSFGHTAGDEVIKEIAMLITGGCRITDTVARYGGEEFAVILPSTDRAGAITMGEQFCHKVSCHQWKRRKVTLSIGLATANFDIIDKTAIEKTGISFIDRADRALYASKAGGRNKVTHEDELG